MPNRALRLVHTSDVHLDGNYKNGDDSTFRNIAELSFAQVVDGVLHHEADLFLIVGDLYDHNRIKKHDVEFVKSQLARVRCPVVLIPGNHDVYNDDSLWHKFDPLDLGDHVLPLMNPNGETIELPDLNVRIWGRAMEEHAPENEPLADAPKRHPKHWNIGLAHGQVVARRVPGTSSQITYDEIGASGFDYLALGHVHVWDDHSHGDTTAFYSGSPVAAYASSQGGFYALVDLHPECGVEVSKNRVESPFRAEEISSPLFI